MRGKNPVLITSLAALLWTFAAGGAAAAEKIRFLLDWKAEAQHGGYYQALANGLYRKHGLEVTILQGGPSVNTQQMIAAGAVDMAEGANDFSSMNLVKAGAPVRAVMASFQKDPQILMTHPRDDIRTLADMKGKPIMISDTAVTSFWVWLKVHYGFSDSQIRKFNNNYAPFLVDPQAIAQGYIIESPFVVAKGGVQPQVFLPADDGYPSYSALVLTTQQMIDGKPEAVQAFVDATIEGWQSFLFGDPSPAFALIKQANPDVTDEENAYTLAKLKEFALVDGGDARTLGIGTMTEARWKSFSDDMVAAKVYPADLDYRQAFTLQFVKK